MSNPDDRRRRVRNRIRIIGILAVTLLGTATIGFGGLAAWTVTTHNNGSTYTTGTVHHSNLAKVGGAGAGVGCTDATSPGSCGVIFTLANAKPTSFTTGTVQITNTGTLQSTFSLVLSSATTSGAGVTLCGDLTLNVVDNEGAPATVYNGVLTSFASAAIKTSAGALNWNTADTGTYTFTVTLPNSSPNTDMGSTCTVAFSWSQTNT